MFHIFHFLQCDMNACTLVPTVFLRNRKTEFELPVSFFVYPRHRKTVFRFPTTLKMEFEPSVFRFCNRNIQL